MKVVYLTAGAAGMYCGSCMRDNTLAAALRAKGRDILLVPVYSAIRTDEPNVCEPRIFYGGINVFLAQKSPLFRHAPRLLNRLLDAPALLRTLSRWSGSAAPEDLGALTVSMLEADAGRQQKHLDKLIRWLTETRPHLVNLPNAMFVGLARPIKEALNVPVFCTLTGEDIFLDKLPEPYRTQALELIRQHARHVDAFVAVSRYYASHARKQFTIPDDRLHVIPLGIHVDSREPPPPPPDQPFTIGYLARICPDKGLHVLCQAFDLLRQAGRKCRLRAAGYLAPADRPYLDDIRKKLADQNIAADFDYVGEIDRTAKLDFLRSLHVLSVPTVYRESKGLYVLEALANGVPVVQPRHGAFPEMIEATGGGLLVEPENPQALADTIARLIDDPALRNRLGCQGRATVIESFTDAVMADRTWALYEQYCPNKSSPR